MAKTKGFLEYKRQKVTYRSIDERVQDFKEIEIPLTPDVINQQTSRCIDCGIPFCHSGCPVANRIPEFNELVYRGRWKKACENLHSTNNFPEITGRVCPAPCEASCTLAVNDEPVLIRHIEYQIVERGFAEGWIVPLVPETRTGKSVAVIGSGPAGLAVAQQLARAGHDVTVFEKDDKPGGLLRYGIPDFKLEKSVIDRRICQMEAEGVKFQTGVKVGADISGNYLHKMFDAVCLTMGAGQPRDLTVPGRGYDHIYFAMDFLSMQNRLNAGEAIKQELITAHDKNVVVIGGGDTGSDCVGTSRRQGAKSITQIEILPKPPQARPSDTPWPLWPRTMRTSSSHEEGCDRHWSVVTKSISGVGTRVSHLHCCQVDWKEKKDGQWEMREIPNSDIELKADLVLLAMGFLHPEHEGLIEAFDLKLDSRGNVAVKNYQTGVPWVFSAGDTISGASLIVRAIDTGRKTADAIDQYLRS